MPTDVWGGLGSQLGQAFGGVHQQRGMRDGAQMAALQSTADLNRAKAQEIARRGQFQSPEMAAQFAAAASGLSDSQGREISDYQRNGNSWGVTPAIELPAELDGPTRPEMAKPAPEWAKPEVIQRFNQGRGAFLANLGGTGNSDAANITKAFAELAGQGRIDTALNQSPQALNALQSAMKGDMYKFAEFGTGDQSTGKVAFNQPYLDKNKSEVGKNSAAAANSYASAGEHKAGAELKRSKIGQPTVNPDGSVTAPTGKPIKLSATAEKELFEADDNIKAGNSTIGLLKQALELNDKAYSGYFAKTRATIRSNLPGVSEQADATVNLDNMMTTQALESLKSTFGAAPTEGERKILLDIQASADKTPKQRKEIIERAIKASEQRMVFNTNKAKSLRSGTYNSVDPQAVQGGSDIEALLNKYGN